MARETKAQKKKIGRVMHEFKHGELDSGSGHEVTNPKQAIAIALSEANVPPRKGDSRRRRGGDHGGSGQTKAELYEEAKKRDIHGRSKMSKDELARALHH